MGNLAGHVLPGSFFIAYGALWCINFLWCYFKTKSAIRLSGESRKKKEKPLHSVSPSFFEYKRDYDLSRKSWIPCAITRIPIEPLFKILLPILGIICETFFDYRSDNGGKKHVVITVISIRDSSGELSEISKLHHITMYGGFLLSGVVDMLTLCVRLPRQTSMLFLTLAFAVEGLLFYHHTIGQDALNIEIHCLLTYSIFACAVFSLLRIFSATNVVVNLCLGSSILLQGTWFVQAGYFLFGGFLDEKDEDNVVEKRSHNDEVDHRYIMFVAACYTWHLLLIALGNVALWIAMSACLRSRILHNRTLRRRGLLTRLRHRWKGSAGSEDQNKLIVEEASNGVENGIEMHHLAETYT